MDNREFRLIYYQAHMALYTYKLKLDLDEWKVEECFRYLQSIELSVESICEQFVLEEDGLLNVYYNNGIEYKLDEFVAVGPERNIAARISFNWGDFEYDFVFGYFKEKKINYLVLDFIDSFYSSFVFYLQEKGTNIEDFMKAIESFNVGGVKFGNCS